MTHLCMSVKRTVSGSVSGYLSASAMAISSKLSQVNVCVTGLLLINLEVLGVHLWLLLQRLARSPRGIPSGFPWITSYDSSTTLSLVIRFFRVILVPVGNLHHDIRRSVRNRLAAQPRLRGDAGRFVQLIEFC